MLDNIIIIRLIKETDARLPVEAVFIMMFAGDDVQARR